MRVWTLLLLVLAGCGDKEADPEDTGDMGGGPCGESGICDLVVVDPVGDCGDGTAGEVVLTLTPAGEGAVEVLLEDHSQGCCPTVEAEAMASQRNDTIDANLWLTGDDCDCVCSLDISFRLEGIPAGSWTANVDGQTGYVEVE